MATRTAPALPLAPAAPDLTFETVAVLLHPHRAVEGALLDSLLPSLEYLCGRAEVLLDEEVAISDETRARLRELGVGEGPRSEILASCDLAVTYGGDGSLIAAASEIQNARTCLLGINAGNLGFLTEGALAEGQSILREVFEGRAWVDRRLKLTARVFRDDEVVLAWDAMNDVVIRQGRTNSLLELEARIDGVEIITYRADGVVVATPSGSTAYALSAGGPIVHPSLEVIELAPIAPFTLSARPILIPTGGVIELSLRNEHHDATLTFDGQQVHGLETDDRIEVRRSQIPVNLVRVRRDDYYRTLREKLGWHRDRA